MTERLREKAREMVTAAYGFIDFENHDFGGYEAEDVFYAALLSARDEALEEAAELVLSKGARMLTWKYIYADLIRSLKSKV